MKKTLIILLVIIIVVAAIVIIAITTKPGGSGTKNDVSDKNNNASLKDVQIAKEIYGFSATIKKIDDKTLTLEGSIPVVAGEPVNATITSLVTDQTKIVKLKFPAEIADKTKPVYPEETPLKLSDLKIGDKINVGCVENVSESIKTNKTITLNNIFIIEQ